MLLVVAHSTDARQALRNIERNHEDAVRRRFGRAALFEESGFGAFLALWLREEHGGDVQVERTVPLNEFRDVPESVRAAAEAYAGREHRKTPYRTFAAGTDHPAPEQLHEIEPWSPSV